MWDALGRQVAGRNYPPTNKNTLIRALTEEWDKLPQQLLDNVVQSMPSHYHGSTLSQTLTTRALMIMVLAFASELSDNHPSGASPTAQQYATMPDKRRSRVKIG
ncbi:hypothetical protein TNCV_2723511 [Trichonephila clavipes]|nr:hypothetical protein TNCV_2723511 [Trichonephila clavipes]